MNLGFILFEEGLERLFGKGKSRRKGLFIERHIQDAGWLRFGNLLDDFVHVSFQDYPTKKPVIYSKS